MSGPFTLGADELLGWSPNDQAAVLAWLAGLVGEAVARDAYEVELVADGRIVVRYFQRGADGLFAIMDGEPVRRALVVDSPTPPPWLQRG